MLRGCGVHVRLVVARPVDPTDMASIPGRTQGTEDPFYFPPTQ